MRKSSAPSEMKGSIERTSADIFANIRFLVLPFRFLSRYQIE